MRVTRFEEEDGDSDIVDFVSGNEPFAMAHIRFEDDNTNEVTVETNRGSDILRLMGIHADLELDRRNSTHVDVIEAIANWFISGELKEVEPKRFSVGASFSDIVPSANVVIAAIKKNEAERKCLEEMLKAITGDNADALSSKDAERILSEPISCLGLKNATFKRLTSGDKYNNKPPFNSGYSVRANIKTVKELVSMNKKELLKFHFIGKHAINDIESALAKHGLRLGMEV